MRAIEGARFNGPRVSDNAPMARSMGVTDDQPAHATPASARAKAQRSPWQVHSLDRQGNEADVPRGHLFRYHTPVEVAERIAQLAVHVDVRSQARFRSLPPCVIHRGEAVVRHHAV